MPTLWVNPKHHDEVVKVGLELRRENDRLIAQLAELWKIDHYRHLADHRLRMLQKAQAENERLHKLVDAQQALLEVAVPMQQALMDKTEKELQAAARIRRVSAEEQKRTLFPGRMTERERDNAMNEDLGVNDDGSEWIEGKRGIQRKTYETPAEDSPECGA